MKVGKLLQSWEHLASVSNHFTNSLSSEPLVVPIRVQLVYRQHVLREILANITSHVSTVCRGGVHSGTDRLKGEELLSVRNI